MNPFAINVALMAKQAVQLQGSRGVAEFERLVTAWYADEPGAVHSWPEVAWQLQGQLRTPKGAEPQCWLHVQAAVQVSLQCQRCLAAVQVPLSVERSFLFVATEAQAAELDAQCEHEVLAMPDLLDGLALIEDELLLHLPLIPRHELCPEPLHSPPPPERFELASVHPFAALATLKKIT
jgi:uncharacterized protein